MRYFSLEEYQCRQTVNAVLLRLFGVANLHERYVLLVAVVVDVLQFAQNLLTLLLVLVICPKEIIARLTECDDGFR